MNSSANSQRVLAIYPYNKGFGFAVVEGPEKLVDYAAKEVAGDRDRSCLKQIADLIVRYRPDVIVVENCLANNCRRSPRNRALIQKILIFAAERKIRLRAVSRAQVRKAFTQFGAFTKYEIALEVARRFPELAPRIPRRRKPWMNEDDRASIFDAVAFALVSLYSQPKNKQERLDNN
jgi:Holliday junction resolvasome RuvABC endonuclease subunit